jgi:hypothetical protein
MGRDGWEDYRGDGITRHRQRRPLMPDPPGPTVRAVLTDGPLRGRSVDAEIVEARPPRTIEVRADDGTTCRYCLAEWNQNGPEAIYSYLYRV